MTEQFRRSFFTCAKVLAAALFAGVIFASVPISADFGWPDAGRHAMDGMFYRDLIADGGYADPMNYALNYYLHYPAITPVLYPPFFGFCQIPGFCIIGPYPWVARLTVGLFLIFGAVGIMMLARDLSGPFTGLYAGLLYLSMPIVIFWGRDVMLEVPAMAIVIWCFYFFDRYLKQGGTGDLILCLLLATAAPYTKQNTIFILGVFALAPLLCNKLSGLTDRRFIAGVVIMGICGIPLAYVTFKWGALNFEQSFGNLKTAMPMYNHFAYYIKKLPQSVGWAVIIFSIAGLLSVRWKKAFRDADMKITVSILISWLLICYLQMSVIKIKEPRHAFFWIPLFAVAGALGLERITSVLPKKTIRLLAGLAVICTVFSYHLVDSKMNWSEGFKEPARYVAGNWEGSAVLINMYGDASFIFHIRALDTEKRLRVYRSSKIFESRMIYKEWGVKSYVADSKELVSLLSGYGIRFVLLENPMENKTQVERLIREVCETDRFEKIREFPVLYPGRVPKTLTLYRYTARINDVKNKPTIHLPVIGIDYDE